VPRLVLLRHGESEWNKENRFTGWVDVDLSPKGREEALYAGKLLLEAKFQFDEMHTSLLKRAVRTLWLVQETLDQMYVPVSRSWRLNERHYGTLQGLNKTETAQKYGEEQVFIWRRSFDIPPPPLNDEQYATQSRDRKWNSVPSELLPRSEALLHCQARVMPYWNETLAPALKSHRTPLIVAHGNSIRALVKHLDKIPDAEIAELNIPTGLPLVYDLNDKLEPVCRRYLGDANVAAAAAAAVANQAKSKN
jgi:2,3-bisphosphoglycerate-dependent phosphoglycerate mutase